MFLNFCQLYATNPAFMSSADGQLAFIQNFLMNNSSYYNSEMSEDGRQSYTHISRKNFSSPEDLGDSNWSTSSGGHNFLDDYDVRSRHALSLNQNNNTHTNHHHHHHHANFGNFYQNHHPFMAQQQHHQEVYEQPASTAYIEGRKKSHTSKFEPSFLKNVEKILLEEDLESNEASNYTPEKNNQFVPFPQHGHEHRPRFSSKSGRSTCMGQSQRPGRKHEAPNNQIAPPRRTELESKSKYDMHEDDQDLAEIFGNNSGLFVSGSNRKNQNKADTNQNRVNQSQAQNSALVDFMGFKLVDYPINEPYQDAKVQPIPPVEQIQEPKPAPRSTVKNPPVQNHQPIKEPRAQQKPVENQPSQNNQPKKTRNSFFAAATSLFKSSKK